MSPHCHSIDPAPRPAMGDPVVRSVGLETEYGIIQPGHPYANPVALSSALVAAYGALSRGGLTTSAGDRAVPVRWDYEGEDPLADIRGGRLDRAAAHPSMLTDNPHDLAPSGDVPPICVPVPGGEECGVPAAASPSERPDPPAAPWGSRPRPSAAEAALPRATTAVLANGGRFYVDHAHPEYSTPEVLTPRDALIWDRAGEYLARQAMTAYAAGAVERNRSEESCTDIHPGQTHTASHARSVPSAVVADGTDSAVNPVVLYKNNVDGKGAAYGSHENYLMRRDVPFDFLSAALLPFLLTRPVFAGAGRVGQGQRSENPGFQISQRADYVENDIGLQTTFNRPLINTRDEPHADASRWRRLHVINGDANHFDTPIFLKVATTSLLLWFIEYSYDRGDTQWTDSLRLLADPVEEHWAMSHDCTLRHTIRTAGGARTAVEIQRHYHDLIATALADAGYDAEKAPASAESMDLWRQVLDVLQTYATAHGTDRQAQATAAAAYDVEWIAKLQVCEGLRARAGTDWNDPKLAALDIQWADTRAGRGLARRLIDAGRVRRLVTDETVEAAVTTPPSLTRAAVRGYAVAHCPSLVGASWTSLLFDIPQQPVLMRLALPIDIQGDEEQLSRFIAALPTT